MFRGNHPARVDEKGRLKVPAEFKRVIDEKLPDGAAKVDAIYKRTLGRPANDAEKLRALKFVRSYTNENAETAGWAALTQTLIACAEFRYVN